MVIYILTKFGADWLIFVDARVLTRKLWTDGRTSDVRRWTVSDHKTSLSTPCSGELKMLVTSIFFLFLQCFQLYQRKKSTFYLILICCLQVLSIWTSLRLCRLERSYTYKPNYKTKVHLNKTATVKPVSETTCIKQTTAVRDHCSETTPLLKST